MANFVCFVAARAAKAAETCARTGLSREGRRLLVYASAETHTWIQKAADLSGLGTDAIRWIATDAEQRMDTGCAAPRDRGGSPPRPSAVSRRRHRGIGQHRRRRSARRRSRRSAANTGCGFTSTAPTARWRRRRRERRRACARWARPIRWRSIRTSGSTRRWKPAACWCAMPPGCATRFRITRPTTTSTMRS